MLECYTKKLPLFQTLFLSLSLPSYCNQKLLLKVIVGRFNFQILTLALTLTYILTRIHILTLTRIHLHIHVTLTYVQMQRLEPFRAEGTETLSTALWHLKKDTELCSLATQVGADLEHRFTIYSYLKNLKSSFHRILVKAYVERACRICSI